MTFWQACLLGATLVAAVPVYSKSYDAAACELHVWPASAMSSVRQRASESNRMTGLVPEMIRRTQQQIAEIADGQAAVRLAESAVPDPLSTARQVEILNAHPVSDRFGGPGYHLVVHPDPLESRMIRTRKTRYSASTTPCYAELVLVEMVYSREYARGRNLKTLFRYRAFAGETATYSFETWTQTKLELFSLDPLRSDEAALNELASALRSNLVLFSEYLERGRKTPAITKGKSE